MKIKFKDEMMNLEFRQGTYLQNGSLAIEGYDMTNGEYFGNLTINLSGYDSIFEDDTNYFDTNNLGEEFYQECKKMGLVEELGVGFSGLAMYPLVRFNLDKFDDWF